ncbi:hypothetical protein DJ568_05720 [Mucilaginibacter hurinus]|uniref:WG repeat-containing protein n=1 Tax=Mucilaginibacter hurinus TaxID=2201324 RepID=A0A367GTU5_9SPHI|nr:hypothetical protein [Mucilaginibacter hurinus]RCH56231.1 hypothetical protein DJ568_05720 [Mucilaginibacter hurinus]
MKPLNIIGAAMLLLVANTSNAQFLNKLKKKAEAAVTKAVTGGGLSAESSTEKPEDNASDGTPGNSTSPAAPAAQSTAAKYGTVLFTMEKGEYLVYGELSLAVKADGAHVKAVTRKDRQFYFYDNGQRQGPFTTPPVNLLDEGWKRDYEYQKTNADEYMSNGMSYLSAGNLVVDGKKYGPALVVNAMYHNTKIKKFYALVTRTENDKMGFYLVSNQGARKLPSIGMGLIVSADGESGGVIIPATQFNAKSEEDAYKFVVADDTYIVLANGKTNGPFKYVDGTRNSLDESGNYIQIGKSGPKEGVYVNGNLLIPFAEGSYGQGASFVNSNGTSAAWFERGNLQFTDGTFIRGKAVQPVLSKENGVSYINWITIEKGNVYHCKKEL